MCKSSSIAECRDTFARFFRQNQSKDGKILEWVVVHDMNPKIDEEFDKMAMHLFVKDTCTIVKVIVSKVYRYFDDIGQIIILS